MTSVAIIGAGRSGCGAALLALKNNVEKILLCDDNVILESMLEPRLKEALKEGQIRLMPEFDAEEIAWCDEIIVSPGIPPEHRLFSAADKNKIVSELEYSLRHRNYPVIVITGSNGKTTTTELCGRLAESLFKRVWVAGNIGTAISKCVSEMLSPPDVAVLEVSTFQLENYENIHADVAVITNITPNHIDRHKTFEEYKRIKLTVGKNQTVEDYAVCREEDNFFLNSSAKVLHIHADDSKESFCFCRNGVITVRDGTEKEICRTDELKIIGKHNIENVCFSLSAVIAIMKKLGREFSESDAAIARNVLCHFPGVEHRIEFVRELNGVKFYNDSKATTAESVMVALECFSGNVILILGGKDKGVSFDMLARTCNGKIKKAVITGYSAPKIRESFDKTGCRYIITEDFDDAVRTAFTEATPGDAVLLSPACTSYDRFRNYEERGRHFKELVAQL